MKTTDWYIENRKVFEKLSEKIKTILTDILQEQNIEYHQIHSRTKEIDSFHKKFENPKYKTVNDITDLAGIRIITYVEDSIPKICRIIENNFAIDEKNSLDKSEDLGLDKVGYKSVHYVGTLSDNRTNLTENKKFKGLKFEIQVRTILQHSWAEIEHDRNYKFGGELPSKIQRRFKLLAGLLELADNEFNNISQEIDKYSNKVKGKTEKGDLNIPINSTSLQEYINQKFKSVNGLLFTNKFNNKDQIIEEIKNYGINKLSEFEKIIPVDLFKFYKELGEKPTPIGFIRDVLIINDYKKYFEKSYNYKWMFTDSKADFAIFEKYGFQLNQFPNILFEI